MDQEPKKPLERPSAEIIPFPRDRIKVSSSSRRKHQMKPKITLRKALSDPELLGSCLRGDSWHSWRSLLLAAMGEPLRPDELAAFTRSLVAKWHRIVVLTSCGAVLVDVVANPGPWRR
jgi:hypothetical protein